MNSTAQIRHQKNTIKGCIYMFLAVLMFGIGNVFIKKMTSEVPVIETLFFRAFFAIIMMLIYFSVTHQLNLLKASNIKLQIFRGFIGFFGLYCLFLSFDLLPLTDATALSFATPLFITCLSVPILKEKVGLAVWISVCIGFIGVSIMAEPTGNITLIGASVAIASAFIEGLVMMLARTLSKQDQPLTSVFYHALVITGVSACLVPFFWVTPSWTTLFYLIILAGISCLGQIFLVMAYSTTKAVVIAPILYTLIFWGALFGYIIWGEILSTNLIIGIPIVILSGLYVIYKESQKKISHVQEIE